MTGAPTTAAHDDAWVALALVEGLTARTALDLATRLGGPEAVLSASPAILAAMGVKADIVASLATARRRAVRELETLAALGATVVTRDDPAYPVRLRTIADPPLALFVRGTLDPTDEPAVAIVGSRRAGEYGRGVAADLARGLAQAGLTVVSGLAAGIDGAAHRGALDGGGRTLAVMGTGIDGVYPTWHRGLAREIAGSGALLSELPVGAPALQFHFPRRNRIIAALTVGTVVVEAAERSGSLITAELAVEQGREVFAVPGPIGQPQHRGCHRLIQHGAKLVTSVEDVLDEIAPALTARLRAARAQAATAALAPEERSLIDALAEGALHVDELVRRTRVEAGRTLETLLALELRGVVAQRPGMRFERAHMGFSGGVA
jgi:DNA processing protein